LSWVKAWYISHSQTIHITGAVIAGFVLYFWSCLKRKYYFSNKIDIQGESKKVWFTAFGTKVYLFLCNSSVRCFFNIFENFKFFLVLKWSKKKSANPFFLSKSKVYESKNVHINYFYRNLNSYKVWITESQKIGKIVIRNFAIFSFGLIFEENLFEFSISFLLSIFKS